VTSTTSERIRRWANLLYLLPVIVALIACEQQQQPSTVRTRIATNSTQAEPQEPPKPPPASQVPAEKSDDEAKKEPPFYGSTYWDELLTSVYYYPKNGDGDFAGTHLKFNHREDDIWLCGDQRKSFEPGNRYRLTVTFEPNAPCITNWRVK
jgi:hypothetical protein